MSLTADSTELGMMLPMRGGLSIAEYYESLIYEFGDGLFDGIPTMLCGEHRGDAVIFSADVTDSGAHFYFEGCEAEKLIFRPKAAILNMKFVGLSDLSGQIFDWLLGALPQLLLCVGR